MSEFTTVARPYAKAAFDFAIEHDQLAQWQTMLGFAAAVVTDDRMQNLLVSDLSANKIADIVIKICGDQLDKYGENFIRIMAENKRLQVLPAVLAQFKEYVDGYKSITEVYVTSAFPLSDKQQKNIIAAMEKRLARKVKLNCNVDSTLIAGAVIRTDEFVIDGSSRGQIARLANELQL
ncbi:F0F1 ATP synthase subunit delta [Gallibacterium anatis]|uniref:F0F1 ATP synthase subunit delta n=1 Tax=Gallibacterium anatis TaxID=750 RepID=UPI000BA0C233|nr:F0F1 ATP synthase subunit delta [Gallibacterium anatis]OZN48837.1 F0F1 ATP synthase subunit delta [Gallibacterium anatis]